MNSEVMCNCGQPAQLVTGQEVYPDRKDLRSLPFWRCIPCRAHVGCHPGTTRPLGRLANMRLRSLRMRVHDALDPHWKSHKGKTIKLGAVRRNVYRRLAAAMKLSDRECHVGMFNEEQCQKALEEIAAWGNPSPIAKGMA